MNYLIDWFNKLYSKEIQDADPLVVKALQEYSWPGNIRELRNFAENAVVLHRGSVIHDYDLEAKFRGESLRVDGERVIVSPLDKEENEKRLLREALADSKGNRTKAAKLMGISRRTLHRKLQQWPELDVVDR